MEPLSLIPAHLLINGTRKRDFQDVLKADKDNEDLRKACTGFEAIFLNKLLQSMRRTVPKSGLLDGGLQEDIYKGMFDERLAQAMAQRGIGIGDMLYRQLSTKTGKRLSNDR